MDNQNEKEITKLELLESMNRSFSRIEEKMATKEDLKNLATKNELVGGIASVKTEIEQVKTDLRAFKQETRDSLEEVNKKIDDLTEIVEDVVLNHGNRIEVLEDKMGIGLAV